MVTLKKLEGLPRPTTLDGENLDRRSAQLDERLASLQAPGAGRKVAATFKRKGKLSSRPKAGTAF